MTVEVSYVEAICEYVQKFHAGRMPRREFDEIIVSEFLVHVPDNVSQDVYDSIAANLKNAIAFVRSEHWRN